MTNGWFSGKYTLPETNSLHLKIDGWKMSFLFGKAYFQGLLLLVSGRVMDWLWESKYPSDAWPTLVRPKVL